MKIELIYEKSCPNIALARDRLRQALQDGALPLKWQEWEVNSPDTPDHLRKVGSPTIMVDGQDVSGAAPSPDGDCCRVYHAGTGYDAAPTVDQITRALRI